MAFLIHAKVGTHSSDVLWVVHCRRKRMLLENERILVRERAAGSAPFGCIVDRVDMEINRPEPFYFLARW
jgi:hypothetical protein